MNTEALIESLTQNVPPVRRNAVGWRLAVGLIGGGMVTIIVIALMLGLRSDLDLAMRGFNFWMKWTYTISLGTIAIWATARLARPDGARPPSLWLVVLPLAALAGFGAVELARTPSADWLAMWLGHSWRICSLMVLLLSAPIFIGFLWSFRRLAPTRLRAAGGTAGLAAGAWAATLYCLHCPEVSAIFVLTWYTLGIVLAAGVGALLGPRVLRW
ncbi:DUF1109 domain-containing protein [Sphingobium phenoxybenzoativorans]|uniref:DUF1109 domain-containing protein n=1 Tax=Sphingobium phenoxybenzoativorans TaxID=1592790 RepID=UPI000871E0A1|nr:DUF1109 domain-containing protein [Sphingobium phenoxybenzoativorans]